MRLRAISLLLSFALGCTTTVAGAPGADVAVADHRTAVEEASPVDVPTDVPPDLHDARADLGSTLPPDAADTADVVDRMTPRADVLDASSDVSIDAATDVSFDAAADVLVDAGPYDAIVVDPRRPDVLIEAWPPGMRPVGRSCAPDGGAPAEHCREVFLTEGTEYTMGALHAWRRSSNWNESMVNFRSCDLVRVRLRRGWIDAHEVTVARYRAWVRAGQPLPPTQSAVRIRAWSGTGDRFVLGTRPYVGSWDVSVTFGDFSLGEGSCTWRDTPGSTEDRPINCISSAQAVAFCYWDGRHVATDAAWEYAARNSTTTDFPTGSLPEPTAFCAIPGVGMVGGACPPTLLPPPIGSYAMGATRNPAGVEELTGGVSEYLARIYPFMLSSERPNQCTIPVDPKNGRVIVPDEFDAAVGPGFVRGLNFALREREARMLVSPSSIVEESGFGPRVGFRCARWAEEP